MYSIEFLVTVRIYYSVSIDRAVAQYYIHYKECSNVFNRKVDRSMVRTMAQCFIQCSIERKTIPSDRAMALMCSIKEDNLPLLWYLGKWGNQVFCEIFRTQNLTLYTLRLVSPWGRPEHTLHTLQPREATQLPNTLHSTQHTLQGGHPTAQGLQETAIQPREATLQPRDFRRPPYSPERLPYSPETTPTVSPAYPAYPAYPSFRQSIPMVPSMYPASTQTTRLQDCIASQQKT